MELSHNLKLQAIEKYLEHYVAHLSNPNNAREVILSREWTNQAPNKSGVYSVCKGSKIIYVGETGNLRGRMSDLLDSRHHVLRRSLGRSLFSKRRGFAEATTKVKFPEQFEILLNRHIERHVRICIVAVVLGRKEIEERLIELHKPTFNAKGLRQA